jgi:hypothetical protein
MRPILPHLLYSGHTADAADYDLLAHAGIQALVQVTADDGPLQPHEALTYCRFPLGDGTAGDEKLLYLAIVTVANLVERHIPTLVCSTAGLSRASAVIAAALSMVFQESPDDCLNQVTENRPVHVNPALWEIVKGVLDGERVPASA